MNITFDQDDLRPLVQAIVDETIEALEQAEAKLPANRLAYPEPEAAALLGVATHALRDARLRGEINATRLGKRMLYQRTELLTFLANGGRG